MLDPLRGVVAAASVLALLIAPAAAVAQEAVYVVRHAERADTSTDSLLSAAGETRAARLGVILKDAGITQIYTTNLRRTIQTAAPLASALGLTPTALPSGDVDGLLAKLHAASPRDRVLVVGHSNTIPGILLKLGVTPAITISDTDYDDLFLAIPREGSLPVFVQLSY